MTQIELQNHIGAFAEYLESEGIDLITFAFLDGKLHVAKTNPTKFDLARMLGGAMRGNAELKDFILTAVGYYILPPQLNYRNDNEE